jgi:hypothetical protein
MLAKNAALGHARLVRVATGAGTDTADGGREAMPARQSASSGQPALAQSGFAVFTGGQHGISAMSMSAMLAGSAIGIASCPTPACAIADARMPATAWRKAK